MIREFNDKDYEIYYKMSKDFYHSNAVIDEGIEDKYLKKTFNLILNNSPYVKGYMILDNEINKNIVGYVLLSFTYSNELGGLMLLLEELYIKKEFQNQGYGSKTLKEIHDLYEDKVTSIKLEVNDCNEEALSLYKRRGFEEREYIQMIKTIDN